MMEKIEWYQEVLEIEPSSKVFFPLAKLLAGNNQAHESIAVLRQGLDRHPDFFEARLMLIELLQQERDSAGALREVNALGAKLSEYPGFWEAWAGSVAATGDHKDLATALRLMAAFLRHGELSWSEIINQGLSAVLGGQEAAAAASAPKAPPAAPKAQPAEQARPHKALVVFERPSVAVHNPAAPVEPSFESVGPESPTDFPVDDDEGEDEQFSLRTKTMATVLAEQGDFAGAKEIYEEILAATADPAIRADLEERIAELALKIKSGHTAPAPESQDDSTEQGKNKLIQVLERLAGRLEDRAEKA